MFRHLIGMGMLTLSLTSLSSPVHAQLDLPPELTRLLERAVTLLPPEVEAKLNLTAEQKKQVARLQSEYEAKHADVLVKGPAQLEKAREALEKVLQQGDIEAVLRTLEEMRDLGQDFQKMRSDYQARLREVLTAEQRKQYDDLTRNAGFLGIRPIDLVPNPRVGGLMDRLGGGPLVSPQMEEKLQLSAEQKKQLAALQKEYEEKAKAVQARAQENVGKVREGVEKAIQDQNPAAVLDALQLAGTQLRANNQLRRDYEDKVRKLLTDEQKQQYDERNRQRPRRLLRGIGRQ
jgi:Spy/CpxP family protein refolding chaperone